MSKEVDFISYKGNAIITLDEIMVIYKAELNDIYRIKFSCKNNKEFEWRIEDKKERDEVFEKIKKLISFNIEIDE
jgi:hypothetical protein